MPKLLTTNYKWVEYYIYKLTTKYINPSLCYLTYVYRLVELTKGAIKKKTKVWNCSIEGGRAKGKIHTFCIFFY